jgi:hypothetical protein
MVNITVSPLDANPVIDFSNTLTNTLYDIVSPPSGLLGLAGKTMLITAYNTAIVFDGTTELTQLVDTALLDVPESRFRLSEKTVTITND